MKIGILTYHRVVNDGSALQAYCLWHLIRINFPEADVEFADYCPKSLKRANLRQVWRRRPPFYKHSFHRRQRELIGFLQKGTKFSAHSLVTDNHEKGRRFLKEQNYDWLVVGSDTVWQLQPRGLFPSFPNLYFDPGKDQKAIGFAVSCDPIPADFLNDPALRNALLSNLSRFQAISYRDEPTHEFLVDLGFEQSCLHFMPDPTLLFDFHPLVRKVKKPYAQGPIAGVAVASPSLSSMLANQLRESGYQPCNLLGAPFHQQPFDSNKLGLGERLGILAEIDFLVTDRFHTSIFFFQLNTGAAVFVEDSNKWSKPNSKGRDLYSRLGRSNFVLRSEEALDADALVKTLSQPAPPTHDKLAEMRARAEGTINWILEPLIKQTSSSS